MLDLVLGGSWRPLGAVLGGSLGGQDAPKTGQDGAKTGQDAPKTAQDGAKTAQDGAKTAPRRPKMAPRRSQDALRCIQVGLKFKHVEIYKNIEKSKEFQRFLGGLGGLSEPKTGPRRPKMAPRRAKMRPRRPKMAPRRRFGRLLEPLGVVLGHLVGALEASWGRFGRSCGASRKL